MSKLDELKQQLVEIQSKIEELEKEENWTMKRPFENKDDYFILDEDGDIYPDCWFGTEEDFNCWKQGNIFSTEEEAKLERKRRDLLTRFRAFRDECNGDWKPDWNDNNERKFYLSSLLEDGERYLIPLVQGVGTQSTFPLFGFFKIKKDAERAIELLGDEIIKLFVEAE